MGLLISYVSRYVYPEFIPTRLFGYSLTYGGDGGKDWHQVWRRKFHLRGIRYMEDVDIEDYTFDFYLPQYKTAIIFNASNTIQLDGVEVWCLKVQDVHMVERLKKLY